MRRSTFISIALHLAILLWAVVAYNGRALDAPLIADVPIDILTPSEFTKIKAGTIDAKDDAPLAPKPDEPKPKAVSEKEAPKPEETQAVPPPPPPPEEKAEAAPKTEPKPEPPKEEKAEKPKPPEPKPEPKKAEAKPDKPKPKPAPKTEAKRDFNADRIAALLNKMPDAAKEPNPKEAPPNAVRKPVHGQASGTEIAMSVNEIDGLRARIAQCWSPPPGGLGADAIIVKLRLQLNEDGSLVGPPSIANSGSSPFFQAAADSAVRAVFQCQPYTLPADKYSVWSDMILTFDPRQMYGSG